MSDSLGVIRKSYFSGKYDCDIDIMIEAKKKELSIMKLYEKYPRLNCKEFITINNILD